MAFYSREIIIERDHRQELLELREEKYPLPKWFYTTSEWSRYTTERMKLLSKVREEEDGICSSQ